MKTGKMLDVYEDYYLRDFGYNSLDRVFETLCARQQYDLLKCRLHFAQKCRFVKMTNGWLSENPVHRQTKGWRDSGGP